MQALSGKLNGILSGIDKNAELIGAGLQAWNKKDYLIEELSKIAQGNIHMPDLAAFGANIKNEPGFQNGVAAAIGGWLLSSLNLDPRINKIGSIAQKGGTGMALFTVVENLLGYATNSPAKPYDQWNLNEKGAQSFVAQAPVYEY